MGTRDFTTRPFMHISAENQITGSSYLVFHTTVHKWTSGEIPRPHKIQFSEREFESRGRHSVEKIYRKMLVNSCPATGSFIWSNFALHIRSWLADRAGSTSHHGQRVDFCGDGGFSHSSIYAHQCGNQITGSTTPPAHSNCPYHHPL